MIKYRNESKEFAWINDFIKTHYDDAETPLIKTMRLVRNSMGQIIKLEKEIKDLKEKNNHL